ncbi:hypothetical protein H0H93_015624 [Arthromyces matolae]|nr:hypothetical protein H0H93_015624 [Arthromyces matolae]
MLDANTVGSISAVASIDWGCAVQVMAAASIGSNGAFESTSAQIYFNAPLWTIGSYDSSIHISEEASNAATAVPWAITLAIAIAGIVGWAINMTLAFCMGTDLEGLSSSPQPMAKIFFQSFGQKGALIIWSLVVIVQYMMGSSMLLAASRQTFAFSRDSALPFSSWLYRMNKFTKTPVNTVVFDGLVAIALGCLAFAGDQAINAVFSLSIIGNYIAYSIPITSRFVGQNNFKRGPFSLGVWHSASANMNYAAAVLGGGMMMSLLGYYFPKLAPSSFKHKRMSSTKTIVVLGAAYGGESIHLSNTNDLEQLKFSPPVLPMGGERLHLSSIVCLAWTRTQGFNVFLKEAPHPHLCLQATVLSIQKNSLTLNKAFPEQGLSDMTIPYDYMIYALGSNMPSPLNLWNTNSSCHLETNLSQPVKTRLPVYRGMKSEGVAWMKEHQKIVEGARTVLVVGGGALGIQFATDIADIYPEKKVTLLHSRKRLLPRFDEAMHFEIMSVLDSVPNISVILGERLDLTSVDENRVATNDCGERVVRTTSGREIAADLLVVLHTMIHLIFQMLTLYRQMLCTGQTPNTSLLKELDPATVNPGDSLAHVLRTMQLGVLPTSSSDEDLNAAMNKLALSNTVTTSDRNESSDATPYPHIFVVGDAADAFGAIAAGHNAYYQGEVAARNVLRLIKRTEDRDYSEQEPLEEYAPGPPAIKVSLGLRRAVFQSQGIVGRKDGAPDDLNAAVMWPMFGKTVTHDDQMYE